MGTRRFWTDGEIKYLRQNYKKVPIAEICAHLNREKRGVYQFARKVGLAGRQIFIPDDVLIEKIQDLHPQGRSDAEICEALTSQFDIPVDRHRVAALRKKLGLASNAFSAHRRNQVRLKTQEQLAKAKLDNLAGLRVARFNQWKRDLGWPEHLTVRAVQALEMFYQHGPLTRVQLCVLMGVSHKKRTAPTSNAKGGTVLAELAAAGLISRAAKSVPVPFETKLHEDPCQKTRSTNHRIKTKSISLYFLNPGVQPNEHRKTGRTEVS